MYIGNSAGLNTVHVRECGTLKSAAAIMLGRNYGENMLVFENVATGYLANVELGMNENKRANGNRFHIQSNSYVKAKNVAVGKFSSENALLVDEAKLYSYGGMCLGSKSDATATDNKVTVRGRNGCIEIESGQYLYTYNESTFRFEVPENGFADIPIQGSHFIWNGNVVFDVDCKKFRQAGGGDIVLVEAGANTWIDQNTDGNLAKCLAELNKSQPEGCSFEIKGKQVIYHASYLPPVGMRFIVR